MHMWDYSNCTRGWEKTPTGVTEKLEDVILEITFTFGTSIQNRFMNTCYWGYTTVQSSLSLFADVFNFVKWKYYTIYLMTTILKYWMVAEVVVEKILAS